MIGKLVRAFLGGLFLAGFVHVVAVLLIPSLAPRDAVGRVFAVAEAGVISAVPADGSILPDLDPAFVHAVCPFDLAKGEALAVTGAMPETFWSFAVVTSPVIAASFERSSAVDNRIDLVVADPDTVESFRLARVRDGNLTASYAAVPEGRGFVLLRAFADDEHPRPALAAALATLACGPAET